MVEIINQRHYYKRIELYDGYLRLYRMNSKGSERVKEISSSIFNRFIIVFSITLLAIILTFEVFIDKETTIRNWLYALTIIFAFISSLMYYRKKYINLVNPVKSDPKYLSFDYNLCFIQDHNDHHPDTDCINPDDPIVEVGMAWLDKKLMNQYDRDAFEDFTYNGYEPEFLRGAESTDTVVPSEHVITVGISGSGVLYPFGNFTEKYFFDFFTNNFRSFEILRETYNLSLNEYDYIFDLGYIVTLPSTSLGGYKGVIIRRRGSDKRVFIYYDGWRERNLSKYLYVKKISGMYIDEQMEKYGKENQ